MKFLVTGGGTGGHIYPALAIAHKIKETFPDAQLLYVGTDKGMESQIVPREGFRFKSIRVKGFRRKISLDTLKSVKELVLGMKDARRIIKHFNPDMVIGTGGYVCGPMVILGAMKGIPSIIHEQNAFPGVTNKILSRFVDCVAISFEESRKYFKKAKNVHLTGNPIRNNFTNIDLDKAYKKFNFKKDIPIVLSFGGSGGQKSLNSSMLGLMNKYSDRKDIQILHVTGKNHYDKFNEALYKRGLNNLSDHIKVVPYLYDMPLALGVSNLVITSAGAITLSEITALGIPSILIPKAYTAENHQEYNARAMEKNGASVVILEKDLNKNILYDTVEELLNNKKKISIMKKKTKALGKLDATDSIMNLIGELLK